MFVSQIHVSSPWSGITVPCLVVLHFTENDKKFYQITQFAAATLVLAVVGLSIMICRFRWKLRRICRSEVKIVTGVLTLLYLVSLVNVQHQPKHQDEEKKLLSDSEYFKKSGEDKPANELKFARGLQEAKDPNNDDWFEIPGSSKSVFVYSAFLDNRIRPNIIRVVAIMKRRQKVSHCRVWDLSNKTYTLTATTKMIREGWSLPYTASYIICSIPTAMDSTLIKVSVFFEKEEKEIAVPLKIHNLEHQTRQGSMSVCVKPLHYNFDRAVWLVEFIEFYRILGADRFFFYNHTMGPSVERVINYYIHSGVVTLLPWSLPVKSQKEIRTEGIFAALNDCNLRSVGHFPLTAFVDIDEFIIPRKHETFQDMIGSLPDAGSYVFQNAFFYLYWENDTTVYDVLFPENQSLGFKLFGDQSKMPYLLTAFKTRRCSKLHRYSERSKYIARPEKTMEAGNHIVWEQVGGKKKSVNVAPDIAISHHFRICEFGGFDCMKNPSEIDRTAHKWLPLLAKSVAQVCEEAFSSLEGCPIAPPLGSPW